MENIRRNTVYYITSIKKNPEEFACGYLQVKTFKWTHLRLQKTTMQIIWFYHLHHWGLTEYEDKTIGFDLLSFNFIIKINGQNVKLHEWCTK